MMQRPEHPGTSRHALPTDTTRRGLDVLVVSADALWPLDRDERSIGCRAARALHERGVRVAVAGARPTPGNAQAWLAQMLVDWPAADATAVRQFLSGWSGLGKDFRHAAAGRMGFKATQLAGVIGLIERYRPATVIALGDAGPALLAGARAADPTLRTVWLGPGCDAVATLRQTFDLPAPQRPAAIVRGVIAAMTTAAFARRVDHVIGLSRTDTAVMRALTLARGATTLGRGVNLRRYFPAKEPIRPQTAVTWAQSLADPALTSALVWFGQEVWPTLRELFPEARWRIVGPDAPPAVKALERIEGIKLVGPLADVRQYARRCRVAILPTGSLALQGKPLVEAMALGMPVVCGQGAAKALGMKWAPGPDTGIEVLACRGRRQWIEAVGRLWSDPEAAGTMEHHARAWAKRHADWAQLGDTLAGLIGQSETTQADAKPKIRSSATPATKRPLPFEPKSYEDTLPAARLRKAA